MALARGFFENEIEYEARARSLNDREDGDALRFPVCGGAFEGRPTKKPRVHTDAHSWPEI